MRNAFGQPQSVLVLGGTSDLALSVVKRLVAERTRTVVLAGRNEAALQSASEELTALGATSVSTISLEASDPARAATTIQEGNEFGTCNRAGAAGQDPGG